MTTKDTDRALVSNALRDKANFNRLAVEETGPDVLGASIAQQLISDAGRCDELADAIDAGDKIAL